MRFGICCTSRRSGRGAAAQPRKGFTLIELLITMTLILILYAMYFGAGTKSEQTRRKEQCGHNLANIHVALKTWSLDHNDLYPTFAGATTSEPVLSQLIPRYTTGAKYFICPGSKDRALPDAQPFASGKISYAYYMGRGGASGASEPLVSDAQVNSLAKPAGVPLFSGDGKKPGNNHRQFGGNVLFCDGSVQASPARAKIAMPLGTNVVLLNPKP